MNLIKLTFLIFNFRMWFLNYLLFIPRTSTVLFFRVSRSLAHRTYLSEVVSRDPAVYLSIDWGTRNSIGPSSDPCGTPLNTIFQGNVSDVSNVNTSPLLLSKAQQSTAEEAWNSVFEIIWVVYRKLLTCLYINVRSRLACLLLLTSQVCKIFQIL